jgi:hypothetical protein
MEDIITVVRCLDEYFSEYGSREEAQATLRVMRALGWPEDSLHFIPEVAGVGA